MNQLLWLLLALLLLVGVAHAVDLKEDFFIGNTEIMSECKLNWRKRRKLERFLKVLPAIMKDYAEKKKLKITGGMPREITIENGPRLEAHRDCIGWCTYATREVWFVYFYEHTFWHEMAHCFYGHDQTNHEDPKTAGVCDEFADWAERNWRQYE